MYMRGVRREELIDYPRLARPNQFKGPFSLHDFVPVFRSPDATRVWDEPLGALMLHFTHFFDGTTFAA